jgi:hypothetical protein
MVGKRVQRDDQTWQALEMLARDRMMSFQEMADWQYEVPPAFRGRLMAYR